MGSVQRVIILCYLVTENFSTLISKKSTNKYQRSGLEDNPSLGSKEYKSSGTNPSL